MRSIKNVKSTKSAGIIKKSILTIATALIFICLPLLVNASESTNSFVNLEILGITTEQISDYNPQRAATRGELAYIVSKLSDGKDYEKSASVFSDITEETEFSGYINNAYNKGIINGNGDGTFNPEGTVSVDNVYRVLVATAGYDSMASVLGGYPEGYRKAASHLGIKGDIATDSSGNVTLQGLLTSAEMLLEKEYEDLIVTISEDGPTIEKSGEKKSVFADRHNIAIYKGIITTVYDEPYSARVKINDNVFSSNKVKFPKGEEKTFLSKTNINLFMYENADVELWVNTDENKILNVCLDKNIQIKFTTVAAVNSDENSLNKYSSKYINYIKLYDDKKAYRTTDDFKIKYDFNETIEPVFIIDRIARVVIKDGEISYLESWGLSEGGIISEISGEYIKYIAGDNDNKKIDKIDTFSRIMVYKNGEGCNYTDLRKDTYFDYFISGNTLLVMASEKTISDILISLSTDSIEIGNAIYNRTNDIYVKNPMGTYDKNGDMVHLYNKKVIAYFDAAGFMRYISASDESTALLNRFLGVIEGAISDTFNSVTKFKVLSFEGERTSDEYVLAKHYTLNCGKTLNDLIALNADVDANDVFEFILNDKREIIEIKEPSMFFGYENATIAPSSSGEIYTDGQYFSVSSKRLLVNNNTPYVLLLEKDGKICAEKVTWSDISSKKIPNIKIRFYGDGEINSNLRLVLLSGCNVGIHSRTTSKGIVTAISKVYKDERIKTQVTVFSGNKESNYVLSDSEALKITSENTLVQFYVNKFGESEIIFDKVYDLDEILLETPPQGWNKSTVYKTDSQRAFIEKIDENGDTVYDAYFFSSAVMVVRRELDGSLKRISFDEILEKETLYYVLENGTIAIAIVE